MAAPKGYSSKEKDDRLKAEHATFSPSGPYKWAMDVKDQGTVHVFASDAAEAGSTEKEIVATGHLAIEGDRIRFTSGALQTYEVDVTEVGANNIVLGQTLPVAPSPGDTFDILRQTSLTLTSSGGLSSVNTFILDGSNQPVTEDTVTPANNRPLPVKLTGFDGDVAINAANLNMEVQLDHDSANPDSVRIGDGVETVAINASNEMQVADDAARTSLASVDSKLVDGNDIGDVTVNNTIAAPANVQLSDGTETALINASQELQVRDDDANTALSSISGDTSNLDVALSTRASEATLSSIDGKLVDGTDIGDVTVNNTNGNPVPVSDAGSSLSVDDNGGSITVDSVDLDIRDLSASQDNVAISDGTNTASVNASSELQTRDDDANTSLSSIDTSTQTIAGWDTGAGAVGATTLRTHLSDETLAALESITVDVDIQHTTDSIKIGDGTNLAAVNASLELQVRDDDANTTLSSIDGYASTLAGTVSGTEVQVDVVAPLPAGTNTIGSVDLNYLDVVDVFDTPLLVASSSNIPGSASAPLEVVASLAADVKKVHLQDTTGVWIGLYTGAAASEVLKMVINPGSDSVVECDLPAATRISVRRLDSTTAASAGELSVNFLG